MFSKRELLVNAFVGQCQISMIKLARASKYRRQRYHAASHPPEVYVGATRVNACLVGGEDAKKFDDVILLACAGHDVIQEAEIGMGPKGFKVRQRKRGDNEKITANWAQIQLEELQHIFGEGSISNDEIKLVHQAIEWTIPAWNQDLMTMVQPGLWEGLKSGTWHPVPVSVAMGDLLPCGHHPETFLATSDPLFVEEQVEFDEILAGLKTQKDLDPQIAGRMLDVMRSWDASQVGFALGRKKAFAIETDWLPVTQRDALRGRVNKFDESAARARWKADSRKSLSVFEYASAMGFQSVPVS